MSVGPISASAAFDLAAAPLSCSPCRLPTAGSSRSMMYLRMDTPSLLVAACQRPPLPTAARGMILEADGGFGEPDLDDREAASGGFFRSPAGARVRLARLVAAAGDRRRAGVRGRALGQVGLPGRVRGGSR